MGEVRNETPAAGFDVAGAAFEGAKAPGHRAPDWVTWTAMGVIALAAAAFMADRGWQRPGIPYASWYWPDQHPGLQIAYGGSRWVLDPRERTVAVPDATMVVAGTFNGVAYFAPRAAADVGAAGGGGGPARPAPVAQGPVYVRVAPDRYVPLTPGGPTPDQIKRRTLEGEPFPAAPVAPAWR